MVSNMQQRHGLRIQEGAGDVVWCGPNDEDTLARTVVRGSDD